MKVISKNCSKYQGENRRRKNMAAIGANAFLEATPKRSIAVVQTKQTKPIK